MSGVLVLSRKKKPKSNGVSYVNYAGNGGSGVGSAVESPETEINNPILDTSDKFSTSVDEDAPKETPLHDYSCAMLKLTPAVSAIVSYWVRKNIPVESLYINEDEGHSGYEDPEEIHTTIKYGINTSNPDDISKILDGYGPITIKLDNISKFSNDNFDVLKIGIKNSPALMELNKDISEMLECPGDTFPDYIPHVTLAYLKKGECENLVGNDFFNLISDTISEIWFTAKDGDDYYISLEMD